LRTKSLRDFDRAAGEIITKEGHLVGWRDAGDQTGLGKTVIESMVMRQCITCVTLRRIRCIRTQLIVIR
jgi:hypothetical protein